MATVPANSDSALPTAKDLRERMATTVLAFRGYNVTNLGRMPELLAHPRYSDILCTFLERGSRLCRDLFRRDVDLIARVREQRDTSLSSYDEAIAMVVAGELAQLEILRSEFDVDWGRCRFTFGYSLGEITAVIAGGALEYEQALRVPLELAQDCVALARDTTLAVLFSRQSEIGYMAVEGLCQEINESRQGVMGISAVLAPNSLLLIGQGDTLDRFAARMSTLSTNRLYLRRNEHLWPPLHTPIVWQRNIPCRARERMWGIHTGGGPPVPPVFSLVTGSLAYPQGDVRATLGAWIDRPQRLWDAVEYTLSKGMTDVIHVGPQANIIPATFDRVAQNVEAQVRGSSRMKALSQMARRPWIQALLPRRASLLRAPQLRQLMLEDWLLEQPAVRLHVSNASLESR